ncbi:MAG: degradosome polyphosphate kinase [Acidobacteria bacterium]|nr:degradosome polyphosphate kinase [Acidobacteriota bacterium]
MSPRRTGNYLNRETSWLEFNRRVLEEAQDPRNPLLERLRFYCIFRSNLDEFFMVRVASLQHLIEEGDNQPDPSGLTPSEQLAAIFTRVREDYEASGVLYGDELLPALEKENILVRTLDQLKPENAKYLDEYFEKEIYPVLTPVAVDESHPPPWLPALAFNLAVLLEPEKKKTEDVRLAFVQVPGRLPGLLRLPDGGALELCWLSDVVRRRLSSLFAGYRILETAGFRLTRDSEMDMDDDGRDDYVDMLESELRKRRRAKPIRLEHEAMSPEFLARIQKALDVPDDGLFPAKGPLDPRPLFILADMPGYERLRYKPQPPLLQAGFSKDRSMFEFLRERDLLLRHPYDSYDPAVRFIEEAAEDPDVLAIKQTLYRTSGKESPMVQALMRAAESGKQVTVLIELTARFDEERNISWARDLEEAGAHVLYGLAGLKVHAKIALVVRREPSGICRYVHLGTGNYNEKTARLYTDFGLLTSAEDFGSDASAFFNTITGYSEPPLFNRLVMSPVGMREKILLLIQREADWARNGQGAEILLKMNSLVDPKIIQELFTAGKAGVRIQMNVRGICCLRPGIPGTSENIRVVSIVDRYLEHSRAFVFNNGGDPEVYLSSADWMPRNMDRRVELMFPILQRDLREQVIDIVRAQLADNQKARVLKQDGTYERVAAGRAEPLRVQEYLYLKNVEEQERIRSLTPVRFAPIQGRD